MTLIAGDCWQSVQGVALLINCVGAAHRACGIARSTRAAIDAKLAENIIKIILCHVGFSQSVGGIARRVPGAGLGYLPLREGPPTFIGEALFVPGPTSSVRVNSVPSAVRMMERCSIRLMMKTSLMESPTR